MELTDTKCSLLLAIFLSSCLAQDDLDGPSPAQETIVTDTTHTLECRLRPDGTVDNVAWQEQMPDGSAVTIFWGEGKPPGLPEKYSNFEIDSDGSSYWNLQIVNVEAEDFGTYACGDFLTAERDTAEREVVAPSQSFIITNGSEVTMRDGDSADIVCKSVGSRPAVDISWFHRMKDGSYVDITSDAVKEDNVNPDDSDRTDTTSTLTCTARQGYNGGELRCLTPERQLVEEMESVAALNVQYPPDVDVQYGNDQVRCTYDANPEPTKFTIVVGNTTEENPSCSAGLCTYDIMVMEKTDVTCEVENDLGKGSDFTIAEPGAVITTPAAPTTEISGGIDADISVNINAICTPTSPSNDVTVIIKVDGMVIDPATDVALPDSGCLDIECIVMKGSRTRHFQSKACKDLQPVSVAVAVPLALIAAGAIVFAIVVLLKSRRVPKEHTDETVIPVTMSNPQQPAVTESSAAQPYMELDQRTRERQGVYQDPQSVTYEDIGESSKPGSDVYQELGQPAKDNDSASKAYVNVPQVNRGRNVKR